MSKQEEAFFEVWDNIEPHADLYNHRMMFDLGYKAAEERIIKLLQTQFDRVYDWKEYPASNVCLTIIAQITNGED